MIRSALDLLTNSYELYRQASDHVRRKLNLVFLERLYIDMAGVMGNGRLARLGDFATPGGHQTEQSSADWPTSNAPQGPEGRCGD